MSKGLDIASVRDVVTAALDEDLGSAGDLTTDSLFTGSVPATAHLVARAEVVLSGIQVARSVFLALDNSLEFEAHRADGDLLEVGDRAATVTGDVRGILKGERTALNFLTRMSGIATTSRAAVNEIAGTGAKILDTRKTAPGLRRLDKYAVACGGADNHRMGLYDEVMIKDTHLGAGRSVSEAVRLALNAGHPARKITVEVRNLDQLEAAIEAGAGRALLDNMDVAGLREAVRAAGKRIVLEASGGLRPGHLREVAETGVDYLSLGWLTHSAPAGDLAMEVELHAP